MQKKFILLVVVIIFIALFLYGSAVAPVERTIEIGSCRASYSTVPVTVRSGLCPNSSACTASPEAQQNNAIVDAVLCGCGAAKSGEYSDSVLNSRIEEVVREFYGYSLQARQVCEQPAFLVRQGYG